MRRPTLSLPAIDARLRSPDVETRGRAAQDLLLAGEQDSSLRDDAVARFEALLARESAPWPATIAATAVQRFGGVERARSIWLTLLAHPDQEMAAQAALAATDRSLAGALLDISMRRPEPKVRSYALRTLGRMRAAEALDAIVAALDDGNVRPDAIAALQDFGDPRAIPALRAYIDDRTEIGPIDNHGPMQSIGDAARDAIGALERAPRPAASILPPTLPRTTAPSPSDAPIPHPRRPRGSVWPFVPLIATIVEVFWFAAVMFVHIVRSGTAPLSDANRQFLDALLIVPGIIGGAVGVAVIVRRAARTPGEIACLAIGMLGCGYILFAFGRGFLAL